MNYQRIYNQLIAKSKVRPRPDCYCEEHHELPVCVFGENDSLVVLTAREHLFAHLLLVKIYPKNYELNHAAFRMSNYWVYGAKEYAWVKEKWANTIRGENNPAKRIEVRKKISDNNPMKNEKYRAEHKIACNTEKRKAAASAKFSGQNNPSCRQEVKEIRRKRMIERHASGESKINLSGNKNPLRNPEILARVLNTRALRRSEAKEKGVLYGVTPTEKHPMKKLENQKTASENAKKQWQNPEMKAKMSAAIKAAHARKRKEKENA